MSIETELRRTIELRNSLNNVRFEKADALRQKETVREMRKQAADLRELRKRIDTLAKKGGYVADGLEKGKLDPKIGRKFNPVLGARVIQIINCASLVASFAGLGLSIGNTWLGQVRNEVNESKFDTYGKELGIQLRLVLNQKKRVDALEKTTQRNTADLDILSGAMGEQTIKTNKIENQQLFLNGQVAGLSNAFGTVTNSLVNTFNTTKQEIFKEIDKVRRIATQPSNQAQNQAALEFARQALSRAGQALQRSVAQERRILELERQRKQGLNGLRNEVRKAQQTANRAIAGANNIKQEFENRLRLIQKKIQDDLKAEEKTALERQKFIEKLLDGKQNYSKTLDLISSNISNFYQQLLRPSVLLDIKPAEIKADVALDLASRQVREIEKVKRDLNFVERGINADINRLKREVAEAGMTPSQENKLDKILLTVGVLGGLAPTIQRGVQNNSQALGQLRQDMPNLTASGVCRTLQPGGCSRNALDGLGNQVNQNTDRVGRSLEGANAVANAAQLTILQRLDTKMGPLLNGGLAGGIKRMFDNAVVDRAINTFALIAAIHNAAMLSNSLFQSILGAGDLILDALGFKVQNAEGQQIDLNQAVRSVWQGFLTNVFGEETVRQINENWARWNRIYQSAANILSLTQSMIDGVRSVIEVSAQYTGKIGNALKSAGIVFDDAYDWMSERMTAARGRLAAFQRFSDGLEQAENITSNIASVAGSVVSIQSEANEFRQETTNFNNLLNDQKNERTQQENERSTASQSPSISIVQERNPSN